MLVNSVCVQLKGILRLVLSLLVEAWSPYLDKSSKERVTACKGAEDIRGNKMNYKTRLKNYKNFTVWGHLEEFLHFIGPLDNDNEVIPPVLLFQKTVSKADFAAH